MSGRGLRGQWTDFMYDIFHGFWPYCPLIFNYNHCKKLNSRKEMQSFWVGKAHCKFTGCVEVRFEIKEYSPDKDSVRLDLYIIGQCNHTNVDNSSKRRTESKEDRVNAAPVRLKRRLTGTKRQSVSFALSQGITSPTKVYDERLASMNDEECFSGRCFFQLSLS